jgi:hypothetical protein
LRMRTSQHEGCTPSQSQRKSVLLDGGKDPPSLSFYLN